MLEFIVLGQIPGTHIQITFAWFVFGGLIALIWLDSKLQTWRPHSSRQKSGRASR